jgi:uncharacterized DUF497 family protein
MSFEWDEEKRVVNLEKHRIDFVDAQILFDGRPAITATSPQLSEDRYLTTGQIGERFYTAVWTWRGEIIRLISVRRARDAEERAYRDVYR